MATAVVGAALLVPAPAAAVPDCPVKPPVRTLLEGQGRLESIIGDARGRLYYTDLTENRLLRLDGPGQQPKVLATEMMRPGGFAFEPDGSLFVGFNGGPLSGVPGNGMAGLLRVDPETGAKEVFVDGLDQANGLVRGPDGSLYTSNNIGGEIARVLPDGTVNQDYANVGSPNGLVLDTSERFLFAAITFRPAEIVRIDLTNPRQVTTVFAAEPADAAAGLDGLTRDAADRLYVAANGAGEIWRVDTSGQACALARDRRFVSNVAFGGGGGFSRSNLYAVTFGGNVLELVGVTDRPPAAPAGSPGTGSPGAAPRPRLHLSVRPRRVVAGRRTRLRFTVTSGGSAVSGVRVRVRGRRVLTDSAGTATLAHRFRRPGVVRVRATRAGYRPGAATIRVRAARRHPAFTG